MTEKQRMTALYPDTKLVSYKEARELIGDMSRCCAACPANYEEETSITCSTLDCGSSGTVFVSPTLYLVAMVNKWERT